MKMRIPNKPFVGEYKGEHHPDSIANTLSNYIGDILKTSPYVVHFNVDKLYIALVDNVMSIYVGGNVKLSDVNMRETLESNITHYIKEWFINEFSDNNIKVIYNWDIDGNGSNLFQSSIQHLSNDTSYITVQSKHMCHYTIEKMSTYILSVPELGKDYKIMFTFNGIKFKVIISACLLYNLDKESYTILNNSIVNEVKNIVERDYPYYEVEVLFNPDYEKFGIFFHESGTSLYKGDCGQNGRGNPLSGISSSNYGEVNESIWGKNENHPAIFLINKAKELLKQLEEIYDNPIKVTLVSTIGSPINEYDVFIETVEY